MPMLSVITTTYQDADGLRTTLASLRPLREGELDWEWVVVDSSPEVTDPVLSAVEADWSLRHLLQPPRGVFPAFNLGVQSARGSLLWFLNSGDGLADLGVLREILVRFAAEPGLDLICCSLDFCWNGERGERFTVADRFEEALIGCGVCHQSTVYSRTVFERFGLYSEQCPLAADYDFHLRCLAAGVRVLMLPERSLSLFDGTGRSFEQRPRAFAEALQIARAHRDEAGWVTVVRREWLWASQLVWERLSRLLRGVMPRGRLRRFMRRLRWHSLNCSRGERSG